MTKVIYPYLGSYTLSVGYQTLSGLVNIQLNMVHRNEGEKGRGREETEIEEGTREGERGMGHNIILFTGLIYPAWTHVHRSQLPSPGR